MVTLAGKDRAGGLPEIRGRPVPWVVARYFFDIAPIIYVIVYCTFSTTLTEASTALVST